VLRNCRGLFCCSFLEAEAAAIAEARRAISQERVVADLRILQAGLRRADVPTVPRCRHSTSLGWSGEMAVFACPFDSGGPFRIPRPDGFVQSFAAPTIERSLPSQCRCPSSGVASQLAPQGGRRQLRTPATAAVVDLHQRYHRNMTRLPEKRFYFLLSSASRIRVANSPCVIGF
jgi:hypothetical protein